MDKAEIENTSIQYLPNEILTLILQHNDCQEIVAFGATCKRFWQMVENNQLLWKGKLKCIIPPAMFDLEDKHCDGNWLRSIKAFFNLRKLIYSEIMAMSPKFYWKYQEVTLDDVRVFFTIALSNNMNYYYVIFILQDLIRKGNTYIAKNFAKKPYTMTEMFYAKVVLRYLVQTFLAVKWVKANMRNELAPENVVNFFLQWIDTVNLYPDTDIEESIIDLVDKVKIFLTTLKPNLAAKYQGCTTELVSEKKVLNAVSQVIYHQRHMAVIDAANLDTLNIIKVLRYKCSNIIVVGAIYQAVARHCGVQCELVAFPNHLFLEWVDRSDTTGPGPAVYTIDLYNGELKPKRRCPFSRSTNSTYKYCPDSLLQYILTSFDVTMGAIRNWSTQNAQYLSDFLGSNHLNLYSNFIPYLMDHTHLSTMNIPLDLTYLNNAYIEIIRVLANLDAPVKPFACRELMATKHIGRVKYAVGMICYHTKLDYVGIIRAWDQSYDYKRADGLEKIDMQLEFGMNQPFYYVVAVDQSVRYVAQENLIDVAHPTRLYHLEDVIAWEFTHFDGFSYVPNDEKAAEYPGEEPIVALYRNRSQFKR